VRRSIAGALITTTIGLAAWWLASLEGLLEADDRVSAMITQQVGVLSFELGLGPEPLLFALQATIGGALLWLGIRGVLSGGR
jgi:hypothetical protein